jgi:hypothetical protein
MSIPLESAQDFHPLEITRQASPESPLMQGDFTLDELRQKFGTSDMTEEAVLAAAGNLGHAFFKIGTAYRSFAPMKSKTAILSPSQENGVEIAAPVEVLENEEGEESDSDWKIIDDPDFDDGDGEDVELLGEKDDPEDDGDGILVSDLEDEEEGDDLDF